MILLCFTFLHKISTLFPSGQRFLYGSFSGSSPIPVRFPFLQPPPPPFHRFAKIYSRFPFLRKSLPVSCRKYSSPFPFLVEIHPCFPFSEKILFPPLVEIIFPFGKKFLSCFLSFAKNSFPFHLLPKNLFPFHLLAKMFSPFLLLAKY